MKKIYHVFRYESNGERKLWITFDNKDAAEKCRDYYNRLAFTLKYNIIYEIVEEQLFHIW